MRIKSTAYGSLLAVVLGTATPAASQDHPRSIYAGKPAESGAMGNGALINADYLKWARGGDRVARIDDVREGVWVIRNHSIVNCTVIETDAGLVIFDTGTTRAEGLKFLKLIRSRTDKPIAAIIYSHNHYTGGAQAMVEDARNPDVMIIGHPKLEANFGNNSLDLRPSTWRRADMQFGYYLPKSGPDAGMSPPETPPASPEEGVTQHVKVNRPVADGERVTIGGTDFVFYHAQGDTDDTLTVWIPRLSTVMTNVISLQFMAMNTLRGQPYREPHGIIASYTQIRDLAPEHYVPSHGDALSGRAAIHHRMQMHRDAYSFTFNQAKRGINLGWSPDEIVERTPLPERFRAEPSLFEGYSEYEFALRGIYTGLIGWFAEDTADMHPPTPARLGAAVVEGFGGRERLLAAVTAAQERREYNLAAKLAGHAVYADPTDREARMAKAAALRSMAHISTGSQAHNFYLTEALDLEGRIDSRKPTEEGFFGLGFGTVANAPPATLVTVLESRIAPERSRGMNQSFALRFSDVNTGFRVDIRDGVAEVRPDDGAKGLASLSIDRESWFDIMTGGTTLAKAIGTGKARLSGTTAQGMTKILAAFDPF
jgi:alkyl sulfatase BDS1-like metallo-beta-lactamase superfamily hydrolase